MTPLEILSRKFKPIATLPRRRRNSRTPEVKLCGIYLLVLGGDIVYVGASVNIRARIYYHRRGCHDELPKRFDRVLWCAASPRRFDSIEGALIRALAPRYSAMAPQHTGNDNAVLVRFGLPPHADESENARTWVANAVRAQRGNRRYRMNPDRDYRAIPASMGA